MKIIGIAGASGSGKSQLARNLCRIFSQGNDHGGSQVMLLSEDNYYHDQRNISFEQRLLTNYDHPVAMDHDLLAAHLRELVAGRAVERPVYNFHEHVRGLETVTVIPPKVLILEGILLFCETALRNLMDLRVFMDVPLDICLIRRIERDVQQRGRSLTSVIRQYQLSVRDGYMQHISPSKRHADLLVPIGGDNPAALALLEARIREMLH